MKQIAPFKLDDNGKDTSERASANIVIVSVELTEGVRDGGKNARKIVVLFIVFIGFEYKLSPRRYNTPETDTLWNANICNVFMSDNDNDSNSNNNNFTYYTFYCL